jgi:hypothetical protein
MRQTQRTLKFLSAITLALLCAACGSLPAHNNTLIFAVKRNFGAELATPSADDPNLSITLGYKERQAAWVPLWANKQTGGLGTGSKQAMDCLVRITTNEKAHHTKDTRVLEDVSCKKGPKFVGDGLPNDGHSHGNESNDAYSTFASFGGNVGVGKDEVASGKMALASFFATGVAAQNLSRNASGLALVSNGKTNDAKEDEKPSTNPAQRMAKDELKKYLEATTLAASDKTPIQTRKACLSKLGASLDAKNPKQFEWLSQMSPKVAVDLWAKATPQSDDEYRKLIGVTYTLHQALTQQVAQDTNVALDKLTRDAQDGEKSKVRADTRASSIEKFCAPESAATAGGTA